jgi:KDO2-lipid IV(A) lauroyltransferase
MFYIVYGLLYLVSLLPFFVLYRISDLFFVVAYYFVGYRKKVVMDNLLIAFPEKSEQERIRIAKKFYKNLIDTFIESIKMLSISDKAFSKRAQMDFTEIKQLIAKGKNIQIHSGHQMNWEYGHWAVALQMPIAWIGVYMSIKNKVVEKIFFKIRNKGKTILVPKYQFKNQASTLLSQQYAIGLVADQNPGQPITGYWLNFFGRPVPFVSGPDKGAIKNNTAVVFVKFVKLKRGYYRFENTVITEEGASMQEGMLTRAYRDFLEATIRENPDNYLWSHRRWKINYTSQFKSRWIDVVEPPIGGEW